MSEKITLYIDLFLSQNSILGLFPVQRHSNQLSILIQEKLPKKETQLYCL